MENTVFSKQAYYTRIIYYIISQRRYNKLLPSIPFRCVCSTPGKTYTAAWLCEMLVPSSMESFLLLCYFCYDKYTIYFLPNQVSVVSLLKFLIQD